MVSRTEELDSPLPSGIRVAVGRGWRILPIQPRGKRPLLRGWPEAATGDLTVLETWAREHPACNWGVATGRPSGLVVIDIDGAEGRASLSNLERQGLTLPLTLTATTGRPDGGEHRYYRMPAADIRNDQSGKIGPHIDVRGTGGFVVCPPSIHSSEAIYRFIDQEAPLADLPAWVVERLTERTTAPAATTQKVPQRVSQGGRTNLLVSLAGSMNRRGMGTGAIEAALIAENREKCDPPLPEEKVRRIAADIVRRYPANESDAGVIQAAPADDFKLLPISELLSRPEVPPDYLVDGLLIRGTVSCVVAKPKVGSTRPTNHTLSDLLIA